MTDQPIEPSDIFAPTDAPPVGGVLVRPRSETKQRYLGRSGRDYGVLSRRNTVVIAAEDLDPRVWDEIVEPGQTVIHGEGEDAGAVAVFDGVDGHLPAYYTTNADPESADDIPHVPFGSDWTSPAVEAPSSDEPSATGQNSPDEPSSSGRRTSRNKS